jgi:hypothetical protein
MAPKEEDIIGTQVILTFRGPTGRVYMAGAVMGPLITEGHPDEYIDPKACGVMNIKLTDIKVVLDD